MKMMTVFMTLPSLGMLLLKTSNETNKSATDSYTRLCPIYPFATSRYYNFLSTKESFCTQPCKNLFYLGALTMFPCSPTYTVHITHAIFFIDLWISYQLFSSHMIFAIFFMPYKNSRYICVRQLLVTINNFNCCFISSSAIS